MNALDITDLIGQHPIDTPFPYMESVMRLVGSQYINDGGKDVDYAVGPMPTIKGANTYWDLGEQSVKLVDAGWQPDAEVYASDVFVSFRKGDVNLIVYKSYDDWDRGVTAAETCRAIRLLTGQPVDKQMRVLIHRVVQDRKDAIMAVVDTQRDIAAGTP